MIRVMGETFDQPEELRLHIDELRQRIADTPEEPAKARRELEARLAVCVAVERRLRRESRRRSLAAVVTGAGVFELARYRRHRRPPMSRHRRYVAWLAVLSFVGLVVTYWPAVLVIAAAALAAAAFVYRRRRSSSS